MAGNDYRKKRVAAGLCQYCGVSLLGKLGPNCQQCADRISGYMRSYHKETYPARRESVRRRVAAEKTRRIESGLCVRCGKCEQAGGRVTCDRCRQLALAGERKRPKKPRTPEQAERERQADRRRRTENPLFKLRQNLRSRLNQIIRGNIGDVSAVRNLGCTVEQLKHHLESMFSGGMDWTNWGRGPHCWHVDHITPLATARTVEDVVRLCHYTNLQPLWSVDNLRKGRSVVQNYSGAKPEAKRGPVVDVKEQE